VALEAEPLVVELAVELSVELAEVVVEPPPPPYWAQREGGTKV